MKLINSVKEEPGQHRNFVLWDGILLFKWKVWISARFDSLTLADLWVSQYSNRQPCQYIQDIDAYRKHFLLAKPPAIGTQLCVSLHNMADPKAVQLSSLRFLAVAANSRKNLAFSINGLHHCDATVQWEINNYGGWWSVLQTCPFFSIGISIHSAIGSKTHGERCHQVAWYTGSDRVRSGPNFLE